MSAGSLIRNPEEPQRPGALHAAWRSVLLQRWAVLGVVTILSLLRTGYEFNVINNAFHIPIVLRFSDMPQFADDLFVQSLSRFVSPVYRLLAVVAHEDTIAGIFFTGLVIVHLLTFLGLLRIASACGVRGIREQTLLLLLLSAAWFTYGYSLIGGDGLLTNYFTHTELARAVAMLSLAMLLADRFPLAGALAGLAFTCNAFIGIWTLAPLSVVAAARLTMARNSAERVEWARAVILGALAFAMIAAPVAIWIVAATAGQEVTFDYPAYLREVFANHFFLDSAHPWGLQNLTFLILAAALAAGRLQKRGDLLLILGSLCAVFVVGALVGAHVHSRLVLNLHLLRVDGMITLLCATLVAAATVVQFCQGRTLGLIVAPLAVFGLLDGKAAVTAAAMAMAYMDRFADLRWLPRLRTSWRAGLWPIALVSLVALSGAQAAQAWWGRQGTPAGIPTMRDLRGANPAIRDWLEVQEWARRSTSPRAQFLVPLDLVGFRAGAQRRVWSSGEDRPVGLWAPESHQRLRERRKEVERLSDPASHFAFACAHDIDYVVLDLRKSQGQPFAPSRAAFLNRWFEVQPSRCGPSP